MHAMHEFLTTIGCRVRAGSTDYILDRFNTEFYLRFDAANDPETPESADTVDIHVVRVSETCTQGIRVVCNCNKFDLMRFLFSIGIEQFGEGVRAYLMTPGVVAPE